MKRVPFLTMAIVLLLSSMTFTPMVATAEENDPVVSRFAVVSDVHTSPISTQKTIDRLPKVFETAYAYAKEQGGTIDAFVFNGDSINGNEDVSGYIAEDEWKLFLAGVRDNVKKESKVLLALARTHDIYDGSGNNFYVNDTEINTLIKEYLGGDASIIPTADWGYGPHLTEVSGVPIITLSNDMDNKDNTDNSYHESEDWLDKELTKLVTANPNRPIFVIFHYPEVGKLGWTQRWGQNSLRDTLNKYPQVIAMNAHVHWDPRLSDGITQDQFTEVYDGAIRDTVGPNDTTIGSGQSPITSYSIVEVTESGAVTIKYIDPETGELLKEANGSGEVLTYSIPKAWDKSTWNYTDEAKFAVAKATFATNASIKLSGNTLTFDRADSEHPIIRYRVDVDNGTTTTTKYVFSDLYKAELPKTYSTTLTLDTSVANTITVTAIDGIYRESANTLTVACAAGATGTITGSATEVIQKTYGENGAVDNTNNYPYFKNYSTTDGAANITDWAISDMNDLKAWSEFSKSNTCEGLTFHLVNDIDMKDEIFNMIGSIYVPFKGNFDGHLHTVSNLFIDDTSGMGTGFFVKTDSAKISNFGIESGLVRGHISNRKYENPGPNTTSFIDVIGVGSIVGRADSTTFTHVWNGADVTYRDGHMTGITNPSFGGLVGRAQSACTFVGCYNTGDVHGLDRASGITNWAQNGANAARIINCFNLGQITREDTSKDANKTEAIGRYNSVNAADNSHFNYNNYYLEGSAEVAGSRDSSSGYINDATEPVALTAEQVRTELANKLNAYNDINGDYADTALWKTDDETGVPYIASLDGSDTGSDTENPGSGTGEETGGNTGGGTGEETGGNTGGGTGEETGGNTENPGYYSINDFATHKDKATTFSVASADDMVTLAALSKNNTLEGYTIKMTADIDMSSVTGFAGIGAENDYHFKGTFDGQNHTISGLTLSKVKKMGLFIRINNGTVQNLTLSGVTITTSGKYCGILAYELTGVVKIHNVHIKDSSIIAGDNYNGGFAAWADEGGSYKLSYCTVDKLTIDGMSGSYQQSAGFVANTAKGVELDHCVITNSTISAFRNAGLLVTYANDTTVKNVIAYGNTLKCDKSSIGLIAGQLQSVSTLENCVFYPVSGAHNTSGDSKEGFEQNCTNFTLFGYQNLNVTVNGSKIYTTAASDTTSTATVTATTEKELASGAIAYALGWSMKDGKICYADDNHKATVKYTYNYGENTEYRYTDCNGDIIGGEVTVPANHKWVEVETVGGKEGDKVFTATAIVSE